LIPLARMSYYDPYYSTPRSRRPSLSYASTGIPLSPSYHDVYPQTAYSQPAYSQPAYSMYAGSNRSSPHLYDDYEYPESYYSKRRGSVGAYSPYVQPMAIPRPRRSSSMSYSGSGYMDPTRRGFGRVIKFKRKGAFTAGITIGEAQANVRLADSDTYTLQDLGVDARGKIYVNLRWPGYPPLNYEIPIDGYGGYVDIQSLARRVGRAVSHYLQANVIPIRWDRIEMQHLEELSIGMWHLKMSTQ
jgi:hypothetical protein